MSGSTSPFFEALRRSSIHFMLRTANLLLHTASTLKSPSALGIYYLVFWFLPERDFHPQASASLLGTTYRGLYATDSDVIQHILVLRLCFCFHFSYLLYAGAFLRPLLGITYR